ncbi:unnamed protein product [Amoebophrya sp. A25]|nr:unnamed protein product [Amoebophrya sp. A25]|eukprot:GSA25T00007590001.1
MPSLEDSAFSRVVSKQSAQEQSVSASKMAASPEAAGVVKIAPKYVIKPAKDVEPAEVFCCRFSPDDSMLAVSYADGTIRVFDADTGAEEFTLNNRQDAGAETESPRGEGEEDALVKAMQPPTFPTTQVRWRPSGSESRTKNVLISVNAENDGEVQHWHIKSGKCLHTIEEAGNQIFCLDYYYNGSIFATAGRDYKVRVYDEATKRLTTTLEGGDMQKTAGHSNRVFSVKFHSSNPNLLVSAGWDNTVQIWDTRKGQSVRSIYGAYICGDAIDLNDESSDILTASYRTTDTLQVWDFGTGQLKDTIPWRPQGHLSSNECMAFTAEYSKPGSRYIIAGGSQNNEAKVFDAKSHQCLGVVSTPKPVFSLNFNAAATAFVVGSADGCVRVLNFPKFH